MVAEKHAALLFVLRSAWRGSYCLDQILQDPSNGDFVTALSQSHDWSGLCLCPSKSSQILHGLYKASHTLIIHHTKFYNYGTLFL